MPKINIHLLCLFCIMASSSAYFQNEIKHFIFFSRDREAIKDSSFYLNEGISGAQIKYTWRQLEPKKNEYDFSPIEDDLNFLTSKGKRLFIQIQDVTFDSRYYAVPKYILTDPVYNGGADSQYSFTEDGKPVKAGWVSRRWDPMVAERFHILLKKLAVEFDGRIEGINLPETAVDFPKIDGLYPKGFSRSSYVQAIKKNMLVLKENFTKSTPLLYANFMPFDSKEDLKEIYDYAEEIKVGMGGPDIKVYRYFQMENSYPLIREMAGIAPTGVAVQEGNYSVINPKTGKQVTVPEILDFATDYLRLNYIFWFNEEPYYTNEVLPLLKSLKSAQTIEPIVLGPELKIHTIEPGISLVVHYFPGACNSLIVQCAENEFVWVDTPLTNSATEQIHQWLCKTYSDPNIIQINTGFHNDNLGGNGYLIEQGIDCYGSDLTVKLLKECWPKTVQQALPYYEKAGEKYRDALVNHKMVPPNKLYPLKEGIILNIGNESVQVYFPGPSHTLDNVVVYFENKQILFGGCMIKSIKSKNLGFTGDANIAAWPTSAQKVLEKFPNTRIVVPGHGRWGNLDLIRHTIKLCKSSFFNPTAQIND